MNYFGKMLDRQFARVARRPRPLTTQPPLAAVEQMEARVLMSATVSTGPNGNLLPAEQRPMESLSLNYTKITYSYDLSGSR